MTEKQRYIAVAVISGILIAAMFIMPRLDNSIASFQKSDAPDTLYVLWEPGKSHIYKWDKLIEAPSTIVPLGTLQYLWSAD